MIADPEHDRVVDLLGVYALDAVEPDESLIVEAHLATCPRCSVELAGLRHVAADLAVAAGLETEQPPPEVWGRIVSGISPRSGSSAPSPAPIVDSKDGSRRRTRRRWAGRRPVWIVGAVGAAAAALIAALAIGLVHTEDQVHDLRSALSGRGSQAAVQAALSSPGHRVVDLRSSDGTELAEVVVRRDGAGYIVHSTMSRLGTAKTYQLWASINGQPISLGLLGRLPVSGSAFSLGTAAPKVRELMVTIEPAGGVPTPDRSPVATAALSIS